MAILLRARSTANYITKKPEDYSSDFLRYGRDSSPRYAWVLLANFCLHPQPPGRRLLGSRVQLTTYHKQQKEVIRLPFVVAVWTRLELATPCVTGRYSNQLNYHTVLVFFSVTKVRTFFNSAKLLPKKNANFLKKNVTLYPLNRPLVALR